MWAGGEGGGGEVEGGERGEEGGGGELILLFSSGRVNSSNREALFTNPWLRVF